MKKSAIQFGVVSCLILVCFAAAMPFYQCTSKNVNHSSPGEAPEKAKLEENKNPQQTANKQQATASLSNSSKTESGKNESDIFTPKSVSYSPYYIAKLINQNQKKWDKLRIQETVSLQPIWDDLGVNFDSSFNIRMFNECSASCKAKISKAQLDEEADKELLLQIEFAGDFCRFLIFKQIKSSTDEKKQWILLGYIDHGFNKYEMASHKVITVGNKSFLVIRGQTGSGSGYSSYGDTWYEVDEKGIRGVLNYASSVGIYPYPDGLIRILRTKISQYQVCQEPCSVLVEFFKSYKGMTDSGKETPLLFTKKQNTFFTWDSQLNQFVFDAVKSGISKDEFESIYYCGLDSFDHCESNEEFLKHNLKSLLLVARGSNSESKKWLYQFLANCNETSEKNLLLKALS
jgi:hypothetical protein